jgi:di/tricarboxylate transporter
MELAQIITLVTFIVTLILGFVSKKSKFISNNLIPVQNLLIGLIVAVVEWIITKDFNTAIALSGIMAGGAYDIVHNIQKMKIENKEEN